MYHVVVDIMIETLVVQQVIAQQQNQMLMNIEILSVAQLAQHTHAQVVTHCQVQRVHKQQPADMKFLLSNVVIVL